MFFCAKQILSYMNTFVVIHELIDKFSHANLRQITMSFVAYQTHGKNVRQGVYDQMSVLAGQNLKSFLEIVVCCHILN